MTDATEVREPIQDGAEGVTTAGPQTLRRRLILGAAAALPSVYTLTSGAQTAVASSVRCWDGDGADEPIIDFRIRNDNSLDDVPRFSMTRDDWLRKDVYYGVCDGHPAFCALEDQKGCIDLMNPSQAALGSVWIAEDGTRIAASASRPVTQVSYSPQAYGLVFVSQDGTLATLDPDSMKHVKPIKETCWTSIIGDKVAKLG